MLNGLDLFGISYNILRAKLGYRIPLKVTHYLTYKCNLKCAFCGRRYNKSDEMQTDQIKNCMDEFKRMGTKYYGFNGGEPLLKDDIGELVTYGKKIGFKTSISTNGTLISKKIDDISDVNMIILSLDGPKIIHDKIRGSGNYEKTVDALKILKEKKIKTFILTVLNKTNLDCLNHLIKLSEEYDCFLEFQPIMIHRIKRKMKQNTAKTLFPQKEEFVQIINWLKKEKKHKKCIVNSKIYLDQLKKYPDITFPFDCWAGRLFCAISPDGRILPCNDMLSESSEYKSGLKIGFKEAFEALPNMCKCKECYQWCYWENNILLNSLNKNLPKIFKNTIQKNWYWC